MAKVRARPETGTLYLDFFFQGVRCREQTALPDTPANRRRVGAFLTEILREIKQGQFNYIMRFPSSPRAKQFAVPLIPETAAGSPTQDTAQEPQDETPTFADFSATWRAEMAPQWRRLHRNSVDAIFKAHLLPAFGDRALSSITKADVLTFRAQIAQLPGRGNPTLSAATINKTIGILRQCLTEASDRFSLSDAFKGVRRLKGRRPNVQPFSLEEVERIRATIRADYRNYVTVRFFSGLRSGEINGLKWKYIDFERGLLLVRETYSDGEVEENAKTEQSIRDVPMLPVVREALQAQWAVRHPESEYVFTTGNGMPLEAHNFANRIWYPLLRYLELERRRPYQTRHTTATLMLAAGENPEWIARLMGHANTQMLFTVYSRFVPNLTREDGRAITGFLNSRSQAAPATPALTLKQIEVMDAAALRKALKAVVATSRTTEHQESSNDNG